MKIFRRLLVPPLLLGPSLGLAAQELPGYTLTPTAPDPVYLFYDAETTHSMMQSTPFPGQSVLGTSGAGVCYENTANKDPYNALFFPAPDELYDWGIKNCGGSSLVEQITIGYAADHVVLSTAMSLRVYGGGRGFGVPGELVLDLRVHALYSPPPTPEGPIPIIMTIDLGRHAFHLPDGPFAWSFDNDSRTAGPLLVDIVPKTGTQNYFDIYRPGPARPNTYQGTYQLPPGGASNDPFENSLYFAFEQNDVVGGATHISGVGNPDLLQALGRPIVGQTWEAKVDVASIPDALSTAVFVSGERLTGVHTIYGELIADASQLATPISVSSGEQHSLDVPLIAPLIGLTFYTQGAYSSSSQGFRLTNGFALLVGAF